MAYYDLVWYCNAGNQSTTGYYAVALRPQNAAVTAGQLVRQFTAPAVNSERVFVCIIAGTTANTTDATWVLTRGAKTVDGTVTWMECTGIAALNSDITNTVNWTAAKAIGVPTLGTIIKRNSGASYQICTTAGTLGAAEPAFSDTAGVTTTETSATTVWTSLGVVGNFTGGQAPHARLANACASTWFAAGNTIYVGDNHAESQATGLSIAPAGSAATVSRILCHNHSGSYPPTAPATGATISTTGAVNTSITPSGGFYIYGLTYVVAVGQSGSSIINFNASNSSVQHDNCSIQLATTGAGAQIQIGSGTSSVNIFNNVTVKFGNVGQSIVPTTGQFTWQNTGSILVSGSSVPNSFISPSAGATAVVTLEALDLSQLTGNIIGAANAGMGAVTIKDCKLNASASVATPQETGCTVQAVRSDSGATAYKSARYQYEGTETTETSITRVGGASDPTSQQQSRKIVTTANSQWLRPFKAEPYAIWNGVTGANVTVTVCGTVNAGALPNNDDIWMDVEYLGSSASPLGTIVNTTKANLLAANAAVASDGSSWNSLPHTTFDGVPSAGIVMSNGNLTVTHGTTGNGTGVSSTALLSGGKYYFECTLTVAPTVSSHAIGINSAGNPFTNMSGNGGVGCTVVNLGSSHAYVNSNSLTQLKDLGAYTVGTVIGVAIDLTNRLAWFRSGAGNWNADGTANPSTGVGGVAIGAGSFAPSVAFSNTSATDSFTANFGQTTFANAAPSGFLSWDTGWTPFKLTTTLSSPQPGLHGYIHVRLKVAKPSSTFYLDPQVTLS